MQKQLLEQLIANTKGKFFSITFIRKDGVERTINGKNRVITAAKPQNSKRTEGEYVNVFNRNKKIYASVHPDRVKEFKCGNLHLIIG